MNLLHFRLSSGQQYFDHFVGLTLCLVNFTGGSLGTVYSCWFSMPSDGRLVIWINRSVGERLVPVNLEEISLIADDI